ncbi:MAG: Perillic acid-CoA ligase GeoC [Sphingomonas bacterium]|nr:Perillic acid-CoA ligase GeoC [Sphingomonas bacterium]
MSGQTQLTAWRFGEIKNIADIPAYWASRTPDAVALIDGERRCSYAELDARANRIANRLLQDDIGPRSIIGFIGKNAIEFWEMWFGASKANCALAPFNWRCTAEELTAIIAEAQPAVLIAGPEFAGTMEAVKERCGQTYSVVRFGDGDAGFSAWLGDADAAPSALRIDPDAIALLSYTSGTTGLPKGVMATQAAFGWSFLCGALEPGMAWLDGDVMLMSMPNFHLGGSWVSLAAFYHGKTLSLLPAFDPAACIEAVARDRVTVASLVPAAIQMLLDHPGVTPDSFASLRSIMYFGSPIGAATMARAIGVMGCALSQFYGTTESYFLTILRNEVHVSGDAARLASCGTPLPLVGIEVRDNRGAPVTPGNVGLVHVRTPMMFVGYRNRPDATADVLDRDGWYSTGDLGHLDADGFLTIVDRAKDMIISGGENVYSTEVELALIKHPGIRTCAVVGMPDPKWGERVVAAVMVDAQAGLTGEAVIAHCRTLIAGYKVPKQVVIRDALPLTPTGKVRKAALRDELLQELAGL